MKEFKFVVIGKESCMFCGEAKRLLARYGENYTYYSIYKKEDTDLGWCMLLEHVNDLNMPMPKTVPQIFLNVYEGSECLNCTHIGGYSELKIFLENEYNSTESVQ